MSTDNNDRRSDPAPAADTGTSDQEYKVGPGRPPKEHQFKPGQSGNPKGRKPKPLSVVPDLRRLFEKALATKVKLKKGEKERNLTKMAVGFEQLANQLAKGDRHARRDVFWLADKLGVELVPAESSSQEPLTAQYQTMLTTWVAKQYDKVIPRPPVFAPPELLDDDPKDQESE